MQAQLDNVKNRIVFVQHMSLRMTVDQVADLFGKFGRLVKCEQLIPGKDLWMIQFSNAKVRLYGSWLSACLLCVCVTCDHGLY
jgi:hypothetical protein